MLFTNVTQFLVLGLMLAIGFLFGLASHPGGKKWRARHDAAQADHAAYRGESEAQLTALERENAALKAELEQERARIPVAASAAVPAVATPPAQRGWFEWGTSRHAAPADARAGDDFTRIRGIDPATAAALRSEGVARFADLASVDDRDEIALERRLGLPAGFIQREQWREQAVLLADDRADEHRGRFS